VKDITDIHLTNMFSVLDKSCNTHHDEDEIMSIYSEIGIYYIQHSESINSFLMSS
jgi:hypothetical protein